MSQSSREINATLCAGHPPSNTQRLGKKKEKRLLTGRNRERDQVRTEVQEAELTQVGGMAEAEKAEHRDCLQHHKSL